MPLPSVSVKARRVAIRMSDFNDADTALRSFCATLLGPSTTSLLRFAAAARRLARAAASGLRDGRHNEAASYPYLFKKVCIERVLLEVCGRVGLDVEFRDTKLSRRFPFEVTSSVEVLFGVHARSFLVPVEEVDFLDPVT